jgi:diketogulonate reductase-like aldo/keto reductase
MDFVTLNNGVGMPKLGFGTYQILKEETQQAVRDALDVGYRLIDTAQSYNNEEEVGNAIRESGIPREEIFITTKVWLENYGYEKCRESVLKSLERLQTDYIDLVLLHQPFSDYYAAYHALEDLYKQGVIRAIGVSNFYPDRLSDIVAFNEITPQVNQIEINPLFQQEEARANMEKNDVQTEAWGPFREGIDDLFTNPILTEIGAQYGKTAAQVILRWLMQRNIVTLAKSVHKDRMQENYDIFDFELSDEDMEKISAMDEKKTLFVDHQTPEAVELFYKFVEERKD